MSAAGTTYAVVPDLMDRGRIDAVRSEVRHVKARDAVARAVPGDLVLVDLGRVPEEDLTALAATGARVVGFAAHVDEDALARASARGVEALARSVFFRRVADL